MTNELWRWTQEPSESQPADRSYELVRADTVAQLLKDAEEFSPGKYPITLTGGTMLMIDNKNPVVTVDGVVQTEHAKAEVHERETDEIRCVKGPIVFTIGGELVNPRQATNADGPVRPGEFVGDGIIGGTTVVLETGDLLRIQAGIPHLHGTSPDSPGAPIVASTFSKVGKEPRFKGVLKTHK